MCGRYALALRPSEVRQQLDQSNMPVAEAPEDEGTSRHTYNFAPGNHGLVYRANGPDDGGKNEHEDRSEQETEEEQAETDSGRVENTKYKLQAMKWGLIPFWTKRNPDYGSMMKTINCRDDSLYEDRGMWTSMKKKKRCIVVAQGFYEWLKKNQGKDKLPHYTKRKDGKLMCFAGLWDCVQYGDSDEKVYTYTVITTDSNKQLKFLHERMPVILENGSEAIRSWLDPSRTEWSKELQSLLKPYEGELECYPVSKEVGKVGNNSPSFIVPIDSADNKNNIANLFGNQGKASKWKQNEAVMMDRGERDMDGSESRGIRIEHDVNESGETRNRLQGSEDNAPLPIRATGVGEDSKSIKRERSDADEDDGNTTDGAPQPKRTMTTAMAVTLPKKSAKAKKTRSARTNGGSAGKSKNASASSKGEGSLKITCFFGK
ncbi:DUF159-domain-containing protein [Pleomassaria siparia CBS 279.74]|uniref:DUF159-domain-containing protein n=1 Tax=Pleomassaria siparia CBS 279.74 TaxID=1314801 RepID=A0A6G1K0Y6_9PLEO|nr:DUF159-domain-containing protein [Pleomassaria siparia CBS 279.74]